MVAATVTLCGYSSGSEQVLNARFLCGFPPRSVFPPLGALKIVRLTLLCLSCERCLLQWAVWFTPLGSACLAHQPLPSSPSSCPTFAVFSRQSTGL